jgi:hypothetical protein
VVLDVITDARTGQRRGDSLNVLVGPANIRKTVTVDATGNRYSGIFTIDQFATDGKTVPAHVGRLPHRVCAEAPAGISGKRYQRR